MQHDWMVWVSVVSLGLIAMYICHSEWPRNNGYMFRRDVVPIRSLRKRC